MIRDKIQLRSFIILGLTVAVLLSIVVSATAQNNKPGADSLTALMRGNERFVEGKLQPKDYISERAKLAQGQQPYAVVLACADSRVAPEIIFDESLGKLFVVRTAGHVVDPVALGSIEYAVEHLHVNLLFVMGHESCGAVKATISGGDASANIKSLLSRIKPAVDKVLSQGIAEKDLLKASVKENVRYQMQKSVFESEVIAEFVHHKKLMIAGGVYSLQTGRVEIISTDLAVERTGDKVEADTHSAAVASIGHQEASEKQSDGAKPDGSHSGGEKQKEHSAPASTKPSFESSIRSAYERKLDVVVKKPMLMRDEHDRCATENCRKIAAGEVVKLDNPHVLNVMGSRQLKVRYKGRPCFILADADAIEVIED